MAAWQFLGWRRSAGAALWNSNNMNQRSPSLVLGTTMQTLGKLWPLLLPAITCASIAVTSADTIYMIAAPRTTCALFTVGFAADSPWGMDEFARAGLDRQENTNAATTK
jgi:hypothetical protein